MHELVQIAPALRNHLIIRQCAVDLFKRIIAEHATIGRSHGEIAYDVHQIYAVPIFRPTWKSK